MSLCVDIEKKLGAFRLRAQFEAQDGTTALLGASGCGKSVAKWGGYRQLLVGLVLS